MAPGRTAEVFCEQVRAAVARSKRRERIALVITDNLKTHTSAGSLLVRSMLTELKEHLYLVYTPAYDPDANRIEWLWRVSRRVVTHNHHRSDFALLLTDVETHFQALAQTPTEVLRHIGSPFAPEEDQDAPLWFQGRAALATLFQTPLFTAALPRRLLPTRANGSPAFGFYLREAATGVYQLAGLMVLGVVDE